MFSPSLLLQKSASHCGEPGETFVDALSDWRRPEGIEYPTIRRIGWKAQSPRRPGDAPRLLSSSSAEVELHRAELFAWAHRAWRSFFGAQLAAIVASQRDECDMRECHPYVLGYVRGAIEEIVDHAATGNDLVLASYLRIAALADVFGLDWVDRLDEAISDLACGRLDASSTDAFEDGIEVGVAEMRSHLSGRRLEPRLLLVWFEQSERALPEPFPHAPRSGTASTGGGDGRDSTPR